MSELCERVEISDTNQLVHKYCTKHFPCGIGFIIILYVLRLSLNSLNAPFNEQLTQNFKAMYEAKLEFPEGSAGFAHALKVLESP